MAKEELYAALRKVCGFEMVSETEGPKQLRAIGRILADRVGRNEENWKIVMYRLLSAMENRPWKADLSKWYFIKLETKKLVHARRVILQGENIARHYEDITHIILSSPPARTPEISENWEIPLAGVSADRNNSAGGRRGAGPTDKVAVGPLAVNRQKMGG